jgi:hypothetical protein
MSWIKRLLQEPLLHFLVLGALIFGVYSGLHLDRQAHGSAQPVYLKQADVQWLANTWRLKWQRPPTREELRGLVMTNLKHELFAREAQAMGLADNDIVIRRRLAQKLEFVLQNRASLVDPTEAELLEFYTTHPDLFQTKARASLIQVFFNPQERQDAAADAQKALTQLAQGQTKRAHLGDPSPVAKALHGADRLTIANQFGRQFAQAVLTLDPGEWSGPIESAYGFHLVQLTDLQPAQVQPFAEVRTQVLERWRDQRQNEDTAAYVAGLMKKYDVVMDESVEQWIGSLSGDSLAENPGKGESGF